MKTGSSKNSNIKNCGNYVKTITYQVLRSKIYNIRGNTDLTTSKYALGFRHLPAKCWLNFLCVYRFEENILQFDSVTRC